MIRRVCRLAPSGRVKTSERMPSRAPDPDLEPGLLGELATQSGDRVLAVVEPAAGEEPLPGHGQVRGRPHQQDLLSAPSSQMP